MGVVVEFVVAGTVGSGIRNGNMAAPGTTVGTDSSRRFFSHGGLQSLIMISSFRSVHVYLLPCSVTYLHPSCVLAFVHR